MTADLDEHNEADEVEDDEGEEKSSTGLDPDMAGLLCYSLGFITGILFLVLEKDSKFVRFHAWQSTLTFGGLVLLDVALAVGSLVPYIKVVCALLSFVLWIPILFLWVFLMYKAYWKCEKYKLPWVGEFAERRA